MANPPKACVIGAGACGLTACKALKERGVPYDCFEKSDDIGGNWYFKNPNNASSAYENLHIDTSKTRMQFSDFPMPDAYPNYAHHSQVFAYFKDYARHFGVYDTITFNTAVDHAERLDDGVWRVTLDNGAVRHYDALFVCNGHHWDPRWPEPPFPGEFHGEEIHSHYFINAEPFRGKRVVIVGIGNSAMDISVETSFVAKATFLSARRSAHIVPKYLFGRPTDTWVKGGLPWWINRIFFKRLLRLQIGRIEQYGLPTPDHELLEAHPSMSSTILDRLAHGEIVPKPIIESFEGGKARFADGSVEPVDVVVYCTGYKVTFPFFDSNFVSAPDNDLPLYKRMMKPDFDNLYFIGLLQPLGAIFPLAEEQARIAADHLAGVYAPPPPADMAREIAADRERMQKRYVKSPRHTMQVDFDPFLAALKRERKRGAKRARRAGGAAPAPKAAHYQDTPPTPVAASAAPVERALS